MNNNGFKELSEKEKRAKLFDVLLKKSNRKLSSKEIEDILKKLDVKNQYKIQVFETAKEMGKQLILKDKKAIFEGGGENGVTESGEVLLGEAIFGLDKFHHSYYDSGRSEEILPEQRECDFDVDQKLIVSIKTIKKDYLKRAGMYNATKYKLLIYIPISVPFVVEPKIQYIMDNFNI